MLWKAHGSCLEIRRLPPGRCRRHRRLRTLGLERAGIAALEAAIATSGDGGLAAAIRGGGRDDRGRLRPRHRHRHGQVRPCRAQARRDARLDRHARLFRSSGRGEPWRSRNDHSRAMRSSPLSWSGETAELADIITYSRRFRIPLVAITSNAEIGARARRRCLPRSAEGRGGLSQRARADDLDDDAARHRRCARRRLARDARLHRP